MLFDIISYFKLEMSRMETGQSPLVNTAAYLAKSVIYNNREMLTASLIVAGWDKIKGGQVLHSKFIHIKYFDRIFKKIFLRYMWCQLAE